MDIQRISDELEIASVLNRYARAVDGKDWDLWRSLFTDDAHIDYSSAGGLVGGRDEVSAWLERSLAQMPMTQHYVTNVEADIDGDTATVRAMFYNPMRLPGASETSACGGYYHHVMVRTESGWRSKQLREENLWFDNPPSAELRTSMKE
ncbi:nuclear transport factor 2 family protein [Mycolicibacterium sphagni]|uniref:nuclear transport factor 2 family protein n=1 Tax=Mycolicibacterium sphagni TaxID=1786 RepID=UPI0021F28296|nr:nuclear transport factor 2 family protein [Mycolicibacterium sphagni]MCV7176940.1 nuclear transport factor 2 family protein [Mycolicibacterium sphagni]